MNGKPKIAFFDFAGCEGCQLTALDSLQKHPELLEVIEIVQFREAISVKGEDYQIAFVEGGCTRPEDAERLQAIRERAGMVIAFGACAHLGGVNAQRNWQALGEVHRYVYGEFGRFQPSYFAKPIDAVIAIDAFLPGCPINPDEFITAVRYLLQGRMPEISDFPVCVECRLSEVPCLFLQGKLCLGPITRAGCSSICPSHGMVCVGCRGQISNANLPGLKKAMAGYGMDNQQLVETLRVFQSYQMIGEKV